MNTANSGIVLYIGVNALIKNVAVFKKSLTLQDIWVIINNK